MKKAVTKSVFGLFLFGAAACKDPNAVRTPAVDAGAAAAVTTAVASATPAAQCATDADCRTFSSYCQESPCACQAIGKGDADPKCSGTPVSCFVNPCARKTAACQSGKCELVVKN